MLKGFINHLINEQKKKTPKILQVWLSDFNLVRVGNLLRVSQSSPVATLRSTENWVRIPLKEITDANKLFCARRREPSRAKDETL